MVLCYTYSEGPRWARERVNEMASTEKEWTDTTNGAAANASSDWGNTVEAESQIVLETEGEGFIGTYLEMESTQAGIVQVHLEDVTDLNGTALGEAMFINATRDLINKLKKVPVKSQIRVEWVSSMDTGQKTPMRVYAVQWR